MLVIKSYNLFIYAYELMLCWQIFCLTGPLCLEADTT